MLAACPNEFAKEVKSNEPLWIRFQGASDWNAGCGAGCYRVGDPP